MTNDLKIFCKNTQEYIDIDGGDTLQQIYETIEKRVPFKPICAMVNNRVESLGYPVFGPKLVEYVVPMSPQGIRVYIHSLCMILYKAVVDTFPGKRLRIEHSISGGFYCTIKHDAELLTPANIERIKARMREIVDQDIKFVRRERLKIGRAHV